MALRSFILRWALRLYWPPFLWIFRFYYWLAIQICRYWVSRIEGVRSIYITGSWARRDVIYGLSDIDFKVLAAGRKNSMVLDAIRRRFSVLRGLFPMLGPPDEKGVFFLDSFHEEYSHYPLVQHLFDGRFFQHHLLWGEDLLPRLPIKQWQELDHNECVFARLRDWIERIHLLADYDGLAAPQKHHLFYKAAGDIARLAMLRESPAAGVPDRAKSLEHICADMEEPFRGHLENLMMEHRKLYRIQLNSDDENFRLFKRIVSLCSEKPSQRDVSQSGALRMDCLAADCASGDSRIAEALKAFSSKIQDVLSCRWPQLPLNPLDLHFFNAPVFVLRCSEPISLNEFHSLKSYYRANLKDVAVVLLQEYPGFLSSVDSTLVDHWGSFIGSSDLTHLLISGDPIALPALPARAGVDARICSFLDQLASILAHPEFGRMDLSVFPVFAFNAMRVMICDHELGCGRWRWLLTPDEIVDYMAGNSPLNVAFLRRLANACEKVPGDGGPFSERLLPKMRALLSEMLEKSRNERTWQCLGKLNEMADDYFYTVSAAIITANRPAQLARCLRSLSQLSRMPQELLVVDSGEGFATKEVVEQSDLAFPVRYLCCGRGGVAFARNIAARAAKGDILAFVDDDACVDPDWLEWLERAFLRDPRIGLVSGSILNMNCGRTDIVWRFMNLMEKL